MSETWEPSPDKRKTGGPTSEVDAYATARRDDFCFKIKRSGDSYAVEIWKDNTGVEMSGLDHWEISLLIRTARGIAITDPAINESFL